LYKILISSAGTGSRVGSYSKFKNKALLQLGLKPAIQHIIDNFPKNLEIVICVGHHKDSLIEVVNALNPERNITYVYVDKYEGEGSGLGYSILAAEEHLQCPFIYSPNDTIITDSFVNLSPIEHGNWIGVQTNVGQEENINAYRCVENAPGKSLILPKGNFTDLTYIGLAGVYDYSAFWAAMRSDEDCILEGEAFGLNQLENVKCVEFPDWLDTGNLFALSRAEDALKSGSINILPKENEAIFFGDHEVVKFHSDPKFISERLNRMSYLPSELLPELTASGQNYFKYRMISGETLSEKLTNELFSKFLDTMAAKLWARKEVAEPNKSGILAFYRDKTLSRVAEFEKRFKVSDKRRTINGRACLSVGEQLNQLDWKDFTDKYVGAWFHGDLHQENILVDENRNFVLLDWRQSFGAEAIEFGDVNYDLGKLLHGFLVPHSAVANNHFSVEEVTADAVELNIARSLKEVEAERLLLRFVEENGMCSFHVRLIASLIFLNIAALHHYPYSKFLFFLGQYLLQELLDE
jgi:choline kinase/aminoglycoside phosphotransferase (APT) family kinase protein